MIVGTTPTHTFNIPFKVSTIQSVSVVYKQKDEVVLKKKTEDCVLENQTIRLTLTQEDTFKFDHKLPVKIQLAVKTETGEVLRSVPISRGVTECLDTEVI